MNEMLLNVESCETRIAHLKSGELYNIVIKRNKNRKLTGNIYRGSVTNVLNNIQSAFIDINETSSGFIHIQDIVNNTKQFDDQVDVIKSDDLATETDITKVLKIGQTVLVQVVKEPIGTKGIRLTSNLSIAGRYIVLLPNNPNCGISRKIENIKVRDHLKAMLKKFALPNGMGVIFRTVSALASDDQLIDEMNELMAIWNQVVQSFNQSTDPGLLYQESSLLKQSIMTAVDKNFDRVVVDDYATYNLCKKFSGQYDNRKNLCIELYQDKVPLFEKYEIENTLQRVMQRKVWLSSGGYLYFDKTEAMYTIDVNSGRSTKNKNSNLEHSIVLINLEAADEIARQIRLRNIGGLIICDFIDMKLRKNKKRVVQRLKDRMKEDSAKCTVLDMSEFGLVEVTRQRNRESLEQTTLTPCPYCKGGGAIKTHETTAIAIERSLKHVLGKHYRALRLVTHPQLDNFLEGAKDIFVAIAHKNHAHLEFASNDSLHLNECYFQSLDTYEKIDI